MIMEETSAMGLCMDPQSGIPGMRTSVESLMVSSQNVSMHDGDAGHTYEVISDLDTPISGGSNELPLNDFMARPIRIQQFTWVQTVGGFALTLNPWALYFNDARVANRLAHYKRFRAKLCVKFIITGNGFYYGRLIASYLPRHNDDELTRRRALINQDLVEATQRPYVMLDPTNSTGGELCLPFIHPYEAIDITAPIDLLDMGEIDFFELNDLTHANGATEGVTVSVFAWAEDFEMSGSTYATSAALTPQAGKPAAKAKDDEYGKGIVSKPASIIAAIAGRLKTVPVIAPYARATEIAASATSAMATMFGYSRPVNIDPTHSYFPRYISNMANADGQDNCTKLTYDSKQETTVDTRVMGLAGEDEMVLSNIASKQTFLATASWASTDLTGVGLFHCPVTPNLFRTYSPQEGVVEYHLPAMQFAGALFQYWRGTLRFRFQIVGSAYHRGRLRIVYDPTTVGDGMPYNVGYSFIVDMGAKRDFTVDVGWTQQQGMLNMGPMAPEGERHEIKPTTDMTSVPNFQNGVIRVEVLNPLTLPSAVQTTAYINVFVSTGDDIEFAGPSVLHAGKMSVYSPQSGFVPQSGENSGAVDMDENIEDDDPQQQETEASFAIAPTNADLALATYIGEVVTSFRQVLKRYCVNYTAPAVNDYVLQFFPTYPMLPGKDPNGYESQFGQPWNTANVTPLNWVLPAYVCYRGGVRVKSCIHSGKDNLFFHSITRVLSYPGNNQRQYFSNAGTPWASESVKYLNKIWTDATHQGTSFTSAQCQPEVEAEIPYHINKKFLFGKVKSQNATGRAGNFINYVIATINRTQPDTPAFTIVSTAAAEDFQVGFYCGPPVMFELEELPQ